MPEKVVISLGGALIVPGKLGRIDTDFLSDFTAFVRAKTKDCKFYIVAGGGMTARRYQKAAEKVLGKKNIVDDDKDWLGIHTTELNAHLLRTLFRDIARPEIIQDPNIPVNSGYSVVIGAGYRPGNTTDWIATRIAAVNGAERVINLSNIPYAYDKDPRKFSNVKPIKRIGWQRFRDNVVGHEYKPGMNVPFDPVASREAHEKGITVIIADGRNLPNLDNILAGRRYVGTTVY